MLSPQQQPLEGAVPTARKQNEKKQRGVFERPKGSGVWWIVYYENGKRHREKVGAKGAAIDLYRVRKAAIRLGQKLPPLKRTAPVMVSDLIDLVLKHTANHKDRRSYISRGEKLRRGLGSISASELTHEELRDWLQANTKTPASWNRYLSLIGLGYRLGMDKGIVSTNPARVKGMRRKEPAGRLRFLSHEEYNRLCKVIGKRFPQHLAEFVVSVHTGMRLSEQYSVEWKQVHLDRRAIDLEKTKNGQARTVHLNADALAAIESMRRQGQKPTDRVFQRASLVRFDNRDWFEPCLKDAKITDYVWHSNRHTFCSWLAMAGATTRELMEAAGHKTMAQSARYAHLSPHHAQSVVDRIAGKGSRASNSHHNSHQRNKKIVSV